jgi:hypothetical protein
MTRHRTAPSVRGVALTDLSAIAGAILWVGLAVGLGLDPIERALALAPLVLVPLGVGFAATPAFDGLAGRLYAAAVVSQPAGAALFAGSLVVDSDVVAAAMASAWLVVAILLALVATVRTADRGPWPLAETVIDAGLAYTVVGAAALVLYHLGLTLWFSPVIVLLTAVHFHYAGFVLPVTTGLVGRCAVADADGVLYRPLAGVVAVGPAIIAVGISFSPAVELLAVGVFTATVAALGGYIALRIAPTRRRPQAVLLAASALALPVSMLLALAYGVTAFTGRGFAGLSISRMVSLHGTLNAFGFGLLATVGWRFSVPTRE